MRLRIRRLFRSCLVSCSFFGMTICAMCVIANHHSPFSQSVRDKMGGFMQTVVLLATLLLCYPLVHVGEMKVAAGLLLAFVPFGANLVQLLVIVAVALEPADVVEARLVGVGRCQGFDTQVKGHNAILTHGTGLAFFPALVGFALILVFVLFHIVIDK